MRTFIKKKNYLHFIKNCIRPPYKKLKSLKSGFIENSNFENNRDPCDDQQHTALSLAAVNRNWEVFKVMVRHPSIVLDVKNKDGLTLEDQVR